MQNLIQEQEFEAIFTPLLEEFRAATTTNLNEVYSLTQSNIVERKYASDNYFTIYPYDNEMNKLKEGRLLKDNRGNANVRVHSFGFDSHSRLLLAEYPISNDAGVYGSYVNCHLYENEGTKSYTIHHYPDHNQRDALVSLTVFRPLSDLKRVMLGIRGIKANDWLLQVYEYAASGRVEKISRFDPAFNLQVDYQMIYDEQGLLKIMTPTGHSQWQRK